MSRAGGVIDILVASSAASVAAVLVYGDDIRRNAGDYREGLCDGICFAFKGTSPTMGPFCVVSARSHAALLKIIYTNVRPDLVYCLYSESASFGPTAPFMD